MVADVTTAASAIATEVAQNASKMMLQRPIPLSFLDFIGLAAIFLCWPLSLLSTSQYVLNQQRALKLYDAQEPNIPLALAALAADQKLSWWKRYREAGPKGWWLATLIHKLHAIFLFLIFTLFVLTFSAKVEEPILPTWLTTHVPDLFLIGLFWHMLLQPFVRARLTMEPDRSPRPSEDAAFNVGYGRYGVSLGLAHLSPGNSDASSLMASRPPFDGARQPRFQPGLAANQLDRAEFFRRTIPNAIFLAPFAHLVYSFRCITGPEAFSEQAGSGLGALAIPIICTMAPWAVANFPTRLRGKSSLLSQCAPLYVLFAIFYAMLVCTDQDGTWGRAIREAFKKTDVVNMSPKRVRSVDGVSEQLPEEAVEIWLDKVCILFPLIAMLGCGVYNVLIGIVLRFEATQLGLDHPTEAQVKAHREKNRRANAQNVATDLHGRRPVALAEAELTKEEMREWMEKARIALITARLTMIVNCVALMPIIPYIQAMRRDDFDHRLGLAQMMWTASFTIPFVTVPLFATLAALFTGGFTRVKQLWSYTERWCVDEREKRRLKVFAHRCDILATAGKSKPHANAVDEKEGAEVEAFLVAEKA